MKLAIALPIIALGETCHLITWACDEIAARLTDVHFPALPTGGFTVDFVTR